TTSATLALSLHDALPIFGQVTEVRDSDFQIDRSLGHSIFVPFGAIGDVTGHQIVLTITAAHIDTIKWPHQSEAADSGSDATIERSEEHTSELQSRFDLVC